MPPNQYREIDQIGQGAYGIVFKGVQKSTGKVVALKKICVALNRDGIPMNTVREIGVLKKLNDDNHPNIVRLLDVCHVHQDQNEITMYLVFEHVDQDLAMYIKKNVKRAFPTQQIRMMSHEILTGVDFLHSNRIVHRDLKPQNLLVTSSGHVKIADFGLAKTYDFEMKLTTVVVTLWYRAPEVLMGLCYKTSVDIWSVGCIIAELYNLRALFPSNSEQDQLNTIFRIMGKPPRNEWPEGHLIPYDSFKNYEKTDIKTHIRNICNNASDLLLKMLTFDPKKRITAANALNHPYFTEEPI